MDVTSWVPAYVGVGSNLHDPPEQVRAAMARSRVMRCSGLYLSAPLGPVSQPDFVNAVAALLTQLTLAEFFAALRALETRLGREPTRQRWGPRRIDLDLLIFGSQRHADSQLTVPHPGIVARNFVLYPLADVAPELEVPELGRVSQLRDHVGAQGISRL